ncbi:hypothetical protein TNCV_5048451 [Trichonephila clavipes]|nr:hypothetical protein TNCV_5048451 [Trichonephila clavipes]
MVVNKLALLQSSRSYHVVGLMPIRSDGDQSSHVGEKWTIEERSSSSLVVTGPLCKNHDLTKIMVWSGERNGAPNEGKALGLGPVHKRSYHRINDMGPHDV